MPRTSPLDITVYPAYVKAYSKRHRIPPRIVVENPLLNLCSLMENKVRFLKLTITEARYRVLAQFPSFKIHGQTYNLNCIPSSGANVRIHGYSFCLSVLDLVRPLSGCLWGEPNLKSFERRKQNDRQSEQQVC